MRAAFTLAVALCMVFTANARVLDPLEDKFARWMEQYGRTYETEAEKAKRFEIFRETVRYVETRQKEGATSLGLTKFADMTQTEFASKYLTKTPVRGDQNVSSVPVAVPKAGSTPSSYNWQDQGAITDVKNQYYCGGCWAFSATEQIESQWFLEGNDLTAFSEQQIISCDSVDAGCNGGDTITAFSYVKRAGGLATEESYPFSDKYGRTSSCSDDFTIAGGSITGYTYATDACTTRKCDDQDEDTLIKNLASTAPASICVDASEWSYYSGGVFNGRCNNGYYNLDHCVQVIGYSGYSGDASSSSSDSYYIVRNSWGTDWGEDGMIYLQIGENACGIADEATFVTF